LKTTNSRRNSLRKVILLIAIFSLFGTLWAADPIIGTWKFNLDKSKLPEGRGILSSPPKEMTDVYREIGSGLIELTSKRVFMDGTSDFDIMTYPAQGGALKSQVMPQEISLFEILLSPGEWCGVYIEDGKQTVSRHKVISEDGKTMRQTIKSADAKGPFEVIEIFEKQ
jgi:hypothetical protein